MMVRNLLLLISMLSIMGCNEDVEAHYRTYSDLENAGVGPRSWMPHWLPRTAVDIHDLHNLDTNSTLISFSVPEATPALLRACRPVTAGRNPGRAPWWPTDQAFATLQHFECEERTTFGDGRVETRVTGAAIDRRSKRIYFWR
jgi:hypothetical protein